jgi:hypothetical protein
MCPDGQLIGLFDVVGVLFHRQAHFFDRHEVFFERRGLLADTLQQVFIALRDLLGTCRQLQLFVIMMALTCLSVGNSTLKATDSMPPPPPVAPLNQSCSRPHTEALVAPVRE